MNTADSTHGKGDGKRLVELDALRGLGMLGVIAAHMDSYVPWFTRVPEFADAAGVEGIILFFVISGYAITLSLKIHRPLQTTSSPIKAFLARRFWRVQPLSWFWLSFVLLGTYFMNSSGYFGTKHENSRGALFVLGMLANWRYVTKEGLGAFGIYWSLAVEEQFYLVYPFLLFKIRNKRKLLLICGAIYLVLAPLIQNPYLTWSLPQYSPMCEFLMAAWWYQPILAGIAVYALAGHYLKHVDPRHDTAIRCLGFFSLVLMPVTFLLPHPPLVLVVTVFYYTIFMAGAAVFSAALSQRNKPFPGAKALSWIGVRSYGLYLSHYPCGILTRIFWSNVVPARENPTPFIMFAGFASFVVLTFGITEVLHRRVEKPLMDYGRRLSKKMLEGESRRSAPNELI